MNAPENIAPEVIEFAEKELAGKLLNKLVDQLKDLKTPWHLVSEHNQKLHIAKMSAEVTTAVMESVQIIASRRIPTIPVTMGKLTFEEDGLKGTISLGKHADGRHELADACGATVYVQLLDAKDYLGGMQRIKPQADQAKLPLGDADATTEPPASAEGAPPSAERELSALPEIRPFQDGFMIYKDEMPIAGARKFKTHEEAETHLREFLGVAVKQSKFERTEAPVVDYEAMKMPELRALWKERAGKSAPVTTKRVDIIEDLRNFDEAAAATQPAADPQAADELPVTPEPVLADVMKDFKDAAKAENGRTDGQEPGWDATWSRIAAKYPGDFIEEHYTELQDAYLEGWEAGEPD